MTVIRLKAYNLVVKRTDFARKMTAAGWSVVRQGSSHEIWGKQGFIFAVPRHREVKPGIVRAWESLNKKIDDDNG